MNEWEAMKVWLFEPSRMSDTELFVACLIGMAFGVALVFAVAAWAERSLWYLLPAAIFAAIGVVSHLTLVSG